MNKKGIDRYLTFGLREWWLREFLNDKNSWLKYNYLGTRQIPSVRNWLKDAELLNRATFPTPLYDLLSQENNIDLVWEIILVNLYYNSVIINWFFNKIDWNFRISRKEMLEFLKNDFPTFSERTLRNSILSLFNTLEEADSPFMNNIAIVEREGRVRIIHKKGTSEVSIFALFYSLYKFAEKTNQYEFSILDFYLKDSNGGPYKIFGISQQDLEDKLRGLQKTLKKIDNSLFSFVDRLKIKLRKDFSPLKVLSFLLENKEIL